MSERNDRTSVKIASSRLESSEIASLRLEMTDLDGERGQSRTSWLRIESLEVDIMTSS